MGFWQNLKTAINKWFLHDSAAERGVSLPQTPSIPQPQPTPQPSGNTGIVPPRVEPPPPLQVEITTPKTSTKKVTPTKEPDVIDNTFKVLSGVVKLAKDTGLLNSLNPTKQLPAKGNPKSTDETDSDDSEPAEINDSSDVVD